LLPSSKARSLFHDKVRISGDVEVGQNVKKLFDELQIDWEGHLAHFTGDVVAHQLGTLVRKGRKVKAQLQDTFCQNVSEHLQEELRLLPSHQELEDFYQDVDDLSLAVDRLQARLKHYMDAHEIN
jgi:ubiquinone biosynthesis protein UbiJ